MKTLTMTLVAVMCIAMTSCQKEEITPSQPNAKEHLKECKNCEGSWDVTTDTIP